MVLANIRIPNANEDVGLIFAVYPCQIEYFEPLLSL
jgi:hypothetical protein